MSEYIVCISKNPILELYKFTIGKPYEIFTTGGMSFVSYIQDDENCKLMKPRKEYGFIPLVEYRNNKINTILQ